MRTEGIFHLTFLRGGWSWGKVSWCLSADLLLRLWLLRKIIKRCNYLQVSPLRGEISTTRASSTRRRDTPCCSTTFGTITTWTWPWRRLYRTIPSPHRSVQRRFVQSLLLSSQIFIPSLLSFVKFHLNKIIICEHLRFQYGEWYYTFQYGNVLPWEL